VCRGVGGIDTQWGRRLLGAGEPLTLLATVPAVTSTVLYCLPNISYLYLNKTRTN
jgi:hypothetical protein